MKKAYFNEMIVVAIIGIMMVVLVGSMELDTTLSMRARRQSCEKIGMEYAYMMESDVCIDNYNKAHYVTIDCTKLDMLTYDCNARIISIGEVRTQ